MRTTPAHGYALNNRTAIAALLALAPVDIEMFLMAALAALTILVITEGRAAIGNTIGDYLVHTYP
jgi:hypothetical protein